MRVRAVLAGIMGVNPSQFLHRFLLSKLHLRILTGSLNKGTRQTGGGEEQEGGSHPYLSAWQLWACCSGGETGFGCAMRGECQATYYQQCCWYNSQQLNKMVSQVWGVPEEEAGWKGVPSKYSMQRCCFCCTLLWITWVFLAQGYNLDSLKKLKVQSGMEDTLAPRESNYMIPWSRGETWLLVLPAVAMLFEDKLFT